MIYKVQKLELELLKKSVTLANNQKFDLDLSPNPGDEKRVFLPHPEIFKSVKKIQKYLLMMGKFY